MANHDLPRKESSAHLALRALHNIGGDAKIPAWMRVLDWRSKQFFFYRDVVARLERCGLVVADSEDGSSFSVTSLGRIYLGVPDVLVPKAPAIPAGPRYVAPKRDLNLSRHRPVRLIREGSLDYMNIPSRMGGQPITYKGRLSDCATPASST